MKHIQDYLTKEGWRRDSVQTGKDLGNIISTIKPKTGLDNRLDNQRGNVDDELLASAAIVYGIVLLLMGASEHVYGAISNNQQIIGEAYKHYKIGGGGTAFGAIAFFVSNLWD